jgi:predicted Zn-ribbon and HTH transcriptional regulator
MPEYEITCNHCGYKWRTRSKLFKVSCPSCQAKVLNPHAEHIVDNKTAPAKKQVITI